MKPIMNSNGQIGHGEGSLVSGGVFTIVSIPSRFVKIDSGGVFRGELGFSFSGGDSNGFISGSVAGGGTISATAQKTRVDGDPVMLLGDSVIVEMSGNLETTGNPPGTIPGCQVKVTDAGQDKARSD